MIPVTTAASPRRRETKEKIERRIPAMPADKPQPG